jgi:multidrug transporter EmrE-like cation transporter
MEKLTIWGYVIVAVAIALFANYLAATWASKDGKFFSLLFLAVLLVSPFVFITFGMVTAKVGVAVGSGTIDAMLTVSTIMLGLFVFKEWGTLSLYQYLGLGSVLIGIVLLQFSD